MTKEEKRKIWKEYEVQKIKEYMATKAEDNNLAISDDELSRLANEAFIQLQDNEEYIEIMQYTAYDILFLYDCRVNNINIRMKQAAEVQEILGYIFYDNFCTSYPVDVVGRSDDWKKFDSTLLSTIIEKYGEYFEFEEDNLKFINDIVKDIENPTVENLYDKLSEIINEYCDKFKAF